MHWWAKWFAVASLQRFLVVGGVNTLFGFGFFPVTSLLIGERTGAAPPVVASYVVFHRFVFADLPRREAASG